MTAGTGPVLRRDVRLSFRPPLMPDNLYGHLVATAVPGVEEWRAGAYRRTVRLPGGPAILDLRLPEGSSVPATLWLSHRDDEPSAVLAARRILDLDVDPLVVAELLAADGVLAPLVQAAPGRRVPGSPDAAELAVRAVLGQQISTAAARTHAARLVAATGEPVVDPDGGLTHLFPPSAALAGADPDLLAMPASRRATVLRVAAAFAAGAVDLSSSAAAERDLVALPGVGPWTAHTVTMRALGDGDAFLPTDLGVVVAAKRLGLPSTPGALKRYSQAWSPYRAYAVQYLWATGEHAVNRLPP